MSDDKAEKARKNAEDRERTEKETRAKEAKIKEALQKERDEKGKKKFKDRWGL